MSVIIKILGNIFITLVFIILIFGALWILSIELQEILEVDILFNLKRKAKIWVYGKYDGKTMGRLFKRGKGRSEKNRRGYTSLKRRLRERAFKQKAEGTKKKATLI